MRTADTESISTDLDLPRLQLARRMEDLSSAPRLTNSGLHFSNMLLNDALLLGVHTYITISLTL